MLQKIFLGIIAVSLVVMIILFIPVFRYYNIEVTNTNLFEEVEEKRIELEELTEEVVVAQNRELRFWLSSYQCIILMKAPIQT